MNGFGRRAVGRALALALLASAVPLVLSPVRAVIEPAAATLPYVTMTCRSGQVDINHATLHELMTGLSLDAPIAQRVIGFRPYLAPRDLLAVEGVGPDRLARLLAADVACATPTQLPPPSSEACVNSDHFDLQVAGVPELTKRLGLSKSVAARLVEQRPFATRRHVNPERVAGLGKGQLPSLLAKTCLTPAPVQTDSAAWRFAYRGLTTTVRRSLFALDVQPGVLDSSGAWLSITDVAIPPTPVTGPVADFHIWGPWSDGTQTVRVTVPADRLPFADPDGEWSDVALHFPNGDPEVITGAALSADTTARTLTYNLTSLSMNQGAKLPSSWLAPFRFVTGPVAGRTLLEDLVRHFTGLRADPPGCVPDITTDQLVTTTGSAVAENPFLGAVPLKFCVERRDHRGLWKLANNTGTVLSFDAQHQARAIEMLPTGDLATDLPLTSGTTPQARRPAAPWWISRPGRPPYSACRRASPVTT